MFTKVYYAGSGLCNECSLTDYNICLGTDTLRFLTCFAYCLCVLHFILPNVFHDVSGCKMYTL